MSYNYNVSVEDTKYLSKTRNKACYFCGKKVENYKPSMCTCNQFDCYLCKNKKPGNFPICKNCEKEYLDNQFEKGKKDKTVKKNGVK